MKIQDKLNEGIYVTVFQNKVNGEDKEAQNLGVSQPQVWDFIHFVYSFTIKLESLYIESCFELSKSYTQGFSFKIPERECTNEYIH